MTQTDPRSKVGPLPNFVIIGAPRSGTTSLAKYLADHPEIFIPVQKEVGFFDNDRNFDRGLGWYRRHFLRAHGKTAVGEASPYYMSDPAAAQRIMDVLRGARLIALLRNPVERAYSHYLHNRTWWRESRSFDEAIIDETAGRMADIRYRYLNAGRYAEHLERYLSGGNCSLEIIFFEDLRDDPAATYAAACAFLGVDRGHRASNLGTIYNPQVEVKSARLFLAIAPMRRRPILRPLVVRQVDRRNVRLGALPPPLHESQRSWLADYFAEPNERLSNLLRVDVRTWWP